MPQAVRSANAPNITASIADSPKADLPLSLSLSLSLFFLFFLHPRLFSLYHPFLESDSSSFLNSSSLFP